MAMTSGSARLQLEELRGRLVSTDSAACRRDAVEGAARALLALARMRGAFVVNEWVEQGVSRPLRRSEMQTASVPRGFSRIGRLRYVAR